jgi:hypothetical protein
VRLQPAVLFIHPAGPRGQTKLALLTPPGLRQAVVGNYAMAAAAALDAVALDDFGDEFVAFRCSERISPKFRVSSNEASGQN